jgi:hypothetical protein
MVETTIPWWRKAIIYALGEIRSGFGFFHSPQPPFLWKRAALWVSLMEYWKKAQH